MANFELVHGAWHSARHWDYLRFELLQAGHEVSAINLPIDTPTTPNDWAKTVAKHVGEQPDVHLVGHSMGAMIIPMVAELVPVASLTYLAPALRRPGSSLALDLSDASNDMLRGGFDFTDLGDGFTAWTDETKAIETFYHDCQREVALDVVRFLRKQCDFFTDTWESTGWPDVPATVIYGTEDKIINPLWVQRFAQETLHLAPIPIATGHSPQLAKPKELARLLMDTIAA